MQGGELEVLIGSEEILSFVDYIYLEVSFVELYQNQPLFGSRPLSGDVIEYLNQRGYMLRGVTNSHIDRVHGPTQADALFCRRRKRDLQEFSG